MTQQDARRAIQILAKSTYRDLKEQGYAASDIMAFASDLLEQVSLDARRTTPDAVAAIPAE